MTQTPKIYRINRQNRLLKNLNSSEEIIDQIIKEYNKKLKFNNAFDIQDLERFEKDDITYYLLVFRTPDKESDWKEFLPCELTSDANFFQQKISLLLFVETDNEMFCVIGGNSYKMVVPFIDHSFGLNTYSRIMSPSEDQLLSIKYRGITGARSGINEQFRDNYRIIDFVKFGNLPQEIHLKLSSEITDLHFDFLKSRDDERIQIYVGKSFKIKKGVDFDDLHKIILEFQHILQLAPNDYLSSYKEIKNEEGTEEFLRSELIRRLFDDASNLGKGFTENTFEHDFCNPNDIARFYEADEYKLKEKSDKGGYTTFDKVNDRKLIYERVLRRAINKCGNDEFNFKVYLQGVRITCYQNDRATIGSSFLFHFTTEFNISGQPIFLIDTKWYKLRDSFVADLKTQTKHILQRYKVPQNILFENWDKSIIPTEGKYNLKYNGKSGYIVLDTIIADGLELCDIIHYDESNVYLIHVKYGFGSKIRELSNQITISARRLRESMATAEKSILGEIYDKLTDKSHDINGLSLEEFIDLFDKKRISYVMAFTSHLKEDILVEDNMERFSSNIARFSLIQCSGEMRANYYDLLTCQIRRS